VNTGVMEKSSQVAVTVPSTGLPTDLAWPDNPANLPQDKTLQ
jgi:hypothetical protein